MNTQINYLLPDLWMLLSLRTDIGREGRVIVCMQADIPERPNKVQQNQRAKGGSALSQRCMHTNSATHIHTNGMFFTSLGYLCVHCVSWKREVHVSLQCGMQTWILDDEVPPFSKVMTLETYYCDLVILHYDWANAVGYLASSFCH